MVAHDNTSPPAQVSKQLLSEYLSLYPKHHRFISSAQYRSGSLKAALEHFQYPFTVHDLTYVTATQISLYLSQMTYVLVSESIKDSSQALSHFIASPDFNDRMHAGQLFFLDLRQRMRRPLRKTGPLSATLTIRSTKRIGGNLFAFLDFSIGDGQCTGNLTIGMGH